MLLPENESRTLHSNTVQPAITDFLTPLGIRNGAIEAHSKFLDSELDLSGTMEYTHEISFLLPSAWFLAGSLNKGRLKGKAALGPWSNVRKCQSLW